MNAKFIILMVFMSNLTFGQIKNGDFETWDSTFTSSYYAELNSDFGVQNPYGGKVANWNARSDYGLCQTTDSFTGNYALILHNWYDYITEKITYEDTLSYRPQYLQGYFKYISGDNNTLSFGTANISLTKFNGTSIDTIATGSYQFDSTQIYTPFQIPLNYISSIKPDSIKIYFSNANRRCGSDMICNLLYLDNLTLNDTPWNVEIKDLPNSREINKPNP